MLVLMILLSMVAVYLALYLFLRFGLERIPDRIMDGMATVVKVSVAAFMALVVLAVIGAYLASPFTG